MTDVAARKEWTVHEAKAAQRKFERAGGDPVDPAGPLFQWSNLHTLDELEARHGKGDRMALMIAIRICANHDLVLPQWAALAYIRAFDAVYNYRTASWDEVLGRQLAKGGKLKAQRQRLELRFHVHSEVCAAHRLGQPIDEGLFDTVGRKFEINGSTARDYFYDVNRKFPYLNPTQDKKHLQKVSKRSVNTRRT